MAIDIESNEDPEERMTEQDAELSAAIEDGLDNERKAEFDGTIETEPFDLDDVLDGVGGDE